MNKQELIRQLVDETGLKPRQVRLVVDRLLLKTMEILSKDNSLILQNFGTFRAVWQNERPGRNPKTGEPKTISSRWTVKFRPGNAFMKALNENDK
mgnify:CR=1 FL=1